MPTLYVRNFPEDLYRKVRSLAAKRRRSMAAEVVVLVENALEGEAIRERRSETLRNIVERRKTQKPAAGDADSLTLLREDRSR